MNAPNERWQSQRKTAWAKLARLDAPEKEVQELAELPHGQVRQVNALTTLSPSGNELTGTATVKLLNRDGVVVDSKTVKVAGQRAPNGLATNP